MRLSALWRGHLKYLIHPIVVLPVIYQAKVQFQASASCFCNDEIQCLKCCLVVYAWPSLHTKRMLLSVSWGFRVYNCPLWATLCCLSVRGLWLLLHCFPKTETDTIDIGLFHWEHSDELQTTQTILCSNNPKHIVYINCALYQMMKMLVLEHTR